MIQQKKTDSKLSLIYSPVKDTIAILVGVLVIVAVFLSGYLPNRRKEGETYYCQIKYQNIYLWDKNDPSSKETRLIPFPKSGKKVLVYLQSDGPIFLGEGKEFQFYSDSGKDGREEPQIEVTLYSDVSIEITYQKSPRNVCENMGKVNRPNMPLVCLPNYFQASIVNKDGSHEKLPEFDN